MSILKNAIDSIIIGVEDYNMDDERRLVSSTRNIYAGILLLFKEKLVQLSPVGSDEVLIKQKILPHLNESNELFWIGEGQKTVDTFSIEKRFRSLNISVDWGRLKKINKYRNNIEHYYSEESKESIQTLLSDSFLVIRDFIRRYLNKDPKELLGEETYNILLKINEVYQAEKQSCINTYNKTEGFSKILLEVLPNLSCEKCGSSLIELNDCNDFSCRICSEIYDKDDLIERSLELKYNLSFDEQKDGEEEKLIRCPYCNNRTYLVWAKECQACSHVASHECSVCENILSSDEIECDEDTCCYCRYKWEKMEKE